MKIRKAITLIFITLFILAGAKTSLDITHINAKELELST